MMTIWKYTVTDWIGDLLIPRGSKIVHVASQGNVFTLWAEVDTEARTVTRAVSVIGTGHRLPDGYGFHIGTVMQGDLVWHVYIEHEVPEALS